MLFDVIVFVILTLCVADVVPLIREKPAPLRGRVMVPEAVARLFRAAARALDPSVNMNEPPLPPPEVIHSVRAHADAYYGVFYADEIKGRADFSRAKGSNDEEAAN